MIGLKEAAGLIASAIILFSSIFVPAGDHGTVALESLDGEGTHAIAGSPVPLDLADLDIYEPIASEGSTVPPATLTGTLDRFTAVASTTGGPKTFTFGDKRLEIPPGAHVTFEHITGTVDLLPRETGTGLSITGTATDVTIDPPEQPSIATHTGARSTLPVERVTLGDRVVSPGYEDAGRFDTLTFRLAENRSEQRTPALTVGQQTIPLEHEQRVILEDYVGVVVYTRVDSDELQLRLDGFGNVTVGDHTLQRNVTQSVSQSLPSLAANAPPEANFTYRPSAPETGETVSFVDESEDDIAIRDWHWDFDDGTESTAQHPEHNFPAAGLYEVTLTVTDAQGEQDEATRTVQVVNSRPHVDLDWTPLTPIETQAVNFTADVQDRDGDVTSVTWSFSDGRSFQGLWVNRTFSEKGVYNVSVVATDSEGASDEATATVHIRNAPPVPGFLLADESPVAGEPTTLTSTSYDPGNGSIVNWTWEIDGQEPFYGEEIEAAFPTDGETSVKLTVRDDDGAEQHTTRQVDVLNPPPGVAIEVSPVYPNPGQKATFLAQIDDDDPAASASWVFPGGLQRTGLSVKKSFDQGGDYEVSLTVTDADGASTTVTRGFSVNHAPSATIRVVGEGEDILQTAVLTGNTLSVEGNVSDPDGNATTLHWTVDSVPATDSAETHCSRTGAPSARVDCTWSDDGRHRLELVAEDTNGAVSARFLDVIVLNRKPSLAPSIDANVVNVGRSVNLSANAADPDGTIASVQWFEDENLLGEGQTLEHTFQTGGTHTLNVNATDDDGAVENVTVTVDVNEPPTVEATVSPQDTVTGVTIDFDVTSAEDPDGSDSELSFHWRFGDGEEATGRNVDHVYTEAGTYTARLSVEDEDGGFTNRSFSLDIDTPPLNPEILVSPSTPQVGDDVTLTVDYDGSRDVDHVDWDLDGEGTPTTGTATLTHAFSEPRTYQVTATIETEDGASAQAGLNLRITGDEPHLVRVTPELPDEQCPDLSQPSVDINLTTVQTGIRVTLDDTAKTWDQVGDCTVETTFDPGTWSQSDGLAIEARVGQATTVRQHAFALDGDLVISDLEIEGVQLDLKDVQVSARGNEPVLFDGDETSTTYHDPLEPVRVTGQLVWRDGTPASLYDVDLTATYDGPRDLLGTNGIAYRSWDTETNASGGFSTFVPAPVLGARAGETTATEPGDSSFVYLPGRYDVRVFASSGLRSDAHRVTFVEDPQGIFEALEDAGIQP